MKAGTRKAVNKDRLITVEFDRQVPDADPPSVEVVFKVMWPSDVTLDDSVPVLMRLSATFTDTRLPATLSSDEEQAVTEAAANKAASSTEDW